MRSREVVSRGRAARLVFSETWNVSGPCRATSWRHTRQRMDQQDPFDIDELAEREDLRRVRTQLQLETEDEDFRWLMAGQRGRRIVWRLLVRSGVWRTSYRPNFGEMSKLEGQKMIGYWALDQISRLCPETYMQMVQEQKNGRAVADNRSSQTT